MVSSDEIASKIKQINSSLVEIISNESLNLDQNQKLSLENLNYYLKNTLTRVLNSGGELFEHDVQLVEQISKAFEIIHKDKVVSREEVIQFIKIAGDLNLSSDEFKSLEEKG